MTDDDSDERSGGTWFGRLRQVIRGDTATREDLLQLLRDAHDRTVLDADELAMLEFTAAERRPDSRLSCQIRMTEALEGLVVHLPERQY